MIKAQEYRIQTFDDNYNSGKETLGGMPMKAKTYSKPNMVNLHGRIGEQILRTLRQQTVKSDDNIRKVAEECKARILADRLNGQ